ncbi:MAG: hypothetical protein AAF211_12900 [Myxococcota bacterium]
MSYHVLVAEAERLLDQDFLDPDEVRELAVRVREHPPTDPEVGRTLLGVIETLTRRTASELQLLERAMKEATASKKALQGYGHAKPSRTRQRANKVV